MEELLFELQTFDAYNFIYNDCLNNYKHKNKFLETVIKKKS